MAEKKEEKAGQGRQTGGQRGNEAPAQLREALMQFQNMQQQLQSVFMQKESMRMRSSEIEKASEEIKKAGASAEVFKVAGNILIKSDPASVSKDLVAEKETINAHLATFEKQEKLLKERLTSLQAKIQADLKNAGIAE